MKYLIIVVVVILLVVGGYFLLSNKPVSDEPMSEVEVPVTTPPEDEGTVTDNGAASSQEGPEIVIGQSVDGRNIVAYNFYSANTATSSAAGGDPDNHVLFVGGIHGGYSWNTAMVAYELMDYLEANPDLIPSNVKVTVIPVLNPDGLNKITGATGRFTRADVSGTEAEKIASRFNAHTVDLNRNFDCEWKATSKWQSRDVSGGTAAFSEPESQAFKAYVEAHDLDAVVVWYSSAGGVFASNCGSGVTAETATLTNLFAEASGYRAYQSFDFYAITGDMVNWLAKEGIPAISVLLTTHDSTDWGKNQAGVEALLKSYVE